MNLTPREGNLQDPDIAVTGNGNVYVTYDVSSFPNGQEIAKSTDCGKTFGPSTLVTSYLPYNAQDRYDSGGAARDCGDFSNHCQSGYTFFRRTTSTRSMADQYDATHECVYIVYDATKPGTEVDTGTTYGSLASGRGSQSAVYFLRYDGATGGHTAPRLINDLRVGHQTSPDISADGGLLHVLWWDSRLDPCYSPARPIGNCAGGNEGTACALRRGERHAPIGWPTGNGRARGSRRAPQPAGHPARSTPTRTICPRVICSTDFPFPASD
jgi:hypothetical protein